MIPTLLFLLVRPATFWLSLLPRNKWAIPVIATLTVFGPFVMEFEKSALRGFAVVSLWALLDSILVITTCCRNPERMEDRIWRAREYADGMFRWIDSGFLPEGSNGSVIASHAKQTTLYCLLALVSANLLSLLLGSALLNYMNYYVARLMLQSGNRVRALLMGWNPWSVLRVIAFLWLGVVLGAPILQRVAGTSVALPLMELAPGLAGVVLDLLIKLTVSRQWSRLLKSNLLVKSSS